MKKDAIGREIPEWGGRIVFHSTDEESAKDIAENGYRYRSGRTQQGYYGEAVSFTEDYGYSRTFGDVTTVGIVADNAVILNTNDPVDWEKWQGLTVGEPIHRWKGIALLNGIDGIYDPGAGDLFMYNPRMVVYRGTRTWLVVEDSK